MTLIPMMSAIIARPAKHSAPAGAAPFARESYDPGATHRPVAAAFAFGLPAALVVAVALSPMIVKQTPRSEPQTWTDFTVDKPKPEPRPDPKPQADPIQTEFTAPPTPLPPVSRGSTDVAPLPPYTPPAGSGTGSTVVDPPLPPKPAPFVVAQVDPRYAGSFQPDYPASEQRREIEGIVRVRVLVGTDGRVKAVELVSTDSQGFFEATKRRALAKWRFKPATRGGVAEESWKEMTVRFQIRNG
ncbi:energy transducer TonB [Sphingopyxis sp.]|uniref:energy transducer TonB n=1 Tax=Sphingopyxis sp. TaxID=1908224 RepID=UPI00261DE8CB|nr:TonB family protein [Sphingopyxis sp.]MCW0196858.1 TonB family protein [Sphingopyxis sp.]